MVVSMSEKKDPHQKIRPVDFDEDDDIIDLTDEISTKSHSDEDIIDLQGSGTVPPRKPAEVPPRSEKNELESYDEDDIIYLDGSPETASQVPGDIIDLDEEIGDDEGTVGEDDMIASAIVESLDTDDDDLQDNRIWRTDDSDTTSEQDEDIIILNEEDEDPGAVSNHAGPGAETDEAFFDSEEEIKLEYGSEEDEYDLFALNGMEDMEELETIAMADQDPDEITEEDIRFDSVDSLGLSSDEDNEILTMDDDSQNESEPIASEDIENLELEENGDLTDFPDELSLELDGVDEEDDLFAADDPIDGANDDMINGASEKSQTPGEVSAQTDGVTVPEYEFTEDSGVMADDEEQAAADDLAAETLEEIRGLAEKDDLPDIDDDMDLDFEDDEGKSHIDDVNDFEHEDETIPFETLEASAVEEEDDIIEITEFDEHFAEVDEKLFENTGVLNTFDPEDDDFLELIEVEEENPVDDKAVGEFSNSDELIAEDEIDNFFSEALEDQPVFENEEIEPTEQTESLSTDLTAAATATDENEEFDFRFGSSEISDRVDRLNSVSSDDSTPAPDIAPQKEALPAEEETGEDLRSAVEDIPASSPMTADQIESILERVIQEKFGGKIENIIYEVIEKVVSREIDRLKGALLDSSGPSNND